MFYIVAAPLHFTHQFGLVPNRLQPVCMIMAPASTRPTLRRLALRQIATLALLGCASAQSLVCYQLGSTALNGEAVSAAEANDGQLYVVGSFTSAGGVAVNGLARWNKSIEYSAQGWSSFGSGPTGSNPAINVVAAKEVVLDLPGNVVYFGGSWTSISGVASANVAMYDTRTSTWAAMGTGCNDKVVAVTVKNDTTAVVGGQFTACGGVATAGVAMWTHGGWVALGAGLNGEVRSVAYVSKSIYSNLAEFIVAVGDFTVPGATYTKDGVGIVTNIEVNNNETNRGVALWELPGRGFAVSGASWFSPWDRPYATESSSATLAAFIGGSISEPDA